MPAPRSHEPGDMYVRLTVNFPDHIDEAAIPLLEQALPPRKDVEIFDKNVMLDEVHLDDTDRRYTNGRSASPQEDDEMGGDEPRVQCANQ